MSVDQTAELAERVRAAAVARRPLEIRAGGTKAFYGNRSTTGNIDRLDPRVCAGIVAYEPTELFITARAGTLLTDVEHALNEQRQVLAFEPPHFGPGATIGGCVAAGLSGPRRCAYGPVSGSVRDFVLGTKLIDGRGQVLSFGGTVIKNVAGYDVARALAGSLGTLGVLVDVTLKVLPRPAAEATLQFDADETTALNAMNRWAGQPLPVSATAWHAGQLWVRLAGANAAVQAAIDAIGAPDAAAGVGTRLDDDRAGALWRGIREQTHAAFAGTTPLWPLWRLALPSTAPAVGIDGTQLIEWNGGQRWLRSGAPAAAIRARANTLGGHATLFRRGTDGGGAVTDESIGAFAPLAPALAVIHRRLKAEFDPQRIFNPGRMYPDL